MEKKTRIVIVDDLPILREGLELLLSRDRSISIVGQASNGKEALDIIEKEPPDVVVADIQMPVMDGIELCKRVRELYSEVHVVAFTMYGDDSLIVDMLEAGAKGYVLKSTSKEELLDAIKAVQTRGTYFCNATTPRMARLIAGSKVNPFRKHEDAKFTAKELEIIQLICQEYSSKQIAPMLDLSQRTVENYRNSILEKTGAKNMIGIAIYAIRNGLYKL